MHGISLLLILCVLRTQTNLANEATVSTDGESLVDLDDPSNAKNACIPRELLSGKVSTCRTYQIATLNASPRRCIHIELPAPPTDDEVSEACMDYPNWFDGTNGCAAYASNPHFCAEFGSWSYQTTPYKANQACCACGGGNMIKPRLRVGDMVTLWGNPQMGNCKDLKIDSIQMNPFKYVVKVMKGCGPNNMFFSNGRMMQNSQFPEGSLISVQTDDPESIRKFYKVELRKCRHEMVEQEFEFEYADKDATMIIVQHKATKIPLVSVMGAVSPIVNITQVWEDGIFDGSGDYFYMEMIADLNAGKMLPNGEPMEARKSVLMSGYFGQEEYSEVRPRPTAQAGTWHDQEFAMWTFKQVMSDDGTSDASDAVDEHVEWLEKKTEMIGIDYLEEMPPWDLLDVDRQAEKKVVKSRFRELSRSFHPDKLLHHPEKKELFEKIFVLLQSAYQGLKSGSEGDKQRFRSEGDTGSQLFTHSQNIVELLPIYWTKIDSNETEASDKVSRYILNVASHLNSTLVDTTVAEQESENTVQLWVVFMYSPKCGMSRTVRGMVDIAAAHLERNHNIKVGAYACGLYKGFEASKTDPIGVISDPICAQMSRRETPNVHVIVETLPGKKFDDNGILVDVPLDPELVNENAKFKHFYAAVPDGTVVEFFPEAFIKFALQGQRVWNNFHLVRTMARSDFNHPEFISNSSLVAFFDGTGNAESNDEVIDAIRGALPGVAHRFLHDGLFVGTASCGYGDEENERRIDCSQYDVSWLPDVKLYGVNDTIGTSLLRGQFGDRRDVQIALESMGNVLRMMLGGEDNNEDDYEEMKEPEEPGDDGGSCQQQQQPPPPQHEDRDLPKLEEPDEVPLLEADKKKDEDKPQLDKEDKPMIEEDKGSRTPKLAGREARAELNGGSRESQTRDRVAGFDSRKSKRAGGGAIMGGGGGGGGGFIAG